MNIVRIGAVQPRCPIPERAYRCLDDRYCRDADAVFEAFIKPHFLHIASLTERAAALGSTIVTTNEHITGVCNYLTDIATPYNFFPALARRAARLADETLSAIASKYGAYIVGCYHRPHQNGIRNAAVLFDRKGDIAGEQHKIHLPANEAWQVEPGDEIQTFALDIARVGMPICYDMMFPEIAQVMALKGARVLIHPTAGYGWYDSIGEATLRVRANDNDVYIVTAKNFCENAAGKSSVIDHWGHVRADAAYQPDYALTCDIDLDEPKAQPEYFYPSAFSGTTDMRLRRAQERRPTLYKAITDPSYHTPRATAVNRKALADDIKRGKIHW